MTVTTHRTACPLDCPDSCSLTVMVSSGRLLSVDATPVDEAANPLTAGFICQKVKHHARRVHGQDRILTPLIRTGAKGRGEFRSASWDEVMQLVADRIREAVASRGPGSVVPYLYNSSAGVLNTAFGARVAAELGFAEVTHTICAAPMGAAKSIVLGGLMSTDPLDIVHAKYIVVWGANPTISNTHLPPLINQAVRKGGAKLVVIDPRRTGIANRATTHLALRPGTDVVLAAAIARHTQEKGLLNQEFIAENVRGAEAFLEACQEWTLDRAASVTGLDAAVVAEVAEEWAATRPATLRIGWGLERNRNGGSGIMAALALPALMGHFGERGSGILHSTASGNDLDTRAVTSPRGISAARRIVSQNDLGEVLNASSDQPEERVEVLVVQGANPALMNLDQGAVLRGLSRNDLFTVVHEQVMTDTCRYADVVLPATTHFEAPDIASGYGAFVAQRFDAVIDRVGESRTNTEFFVELGRRLGLDLPDATDAALVERIRAPRPFGEARTSGSSVQFVDTFPTRDDRKIHLMAPEYVALEVNEGELVLLSPANSKTINSVFGERHGVPSIHINPVDAQARTVVDGQRVEVFNDGGRLTLTANITDETRPGVVVIAKGFWSRAFGDSGISLNSLTPRLVEPLAGGACFNDARVRVVAL